MDKYDKLRKRERNQWIEQYVRDHPNATLADVGAIFNISRQRVWEILKLAKEKKIKEAITV